MAYSKAKLKSSGDRASVKEQVANKIAAVVNKFHQKFGYNA
jgi:hypothetical protein